MKEQLLYGISPFSHSESLQKERTPTWGYDSLKAGDLGADNDKYLSLEFQEPLESHTENRVKFLNPDQMGAEYSSLAHRNGGGARLNFEVNNMEYGISTPEVRENFTSTERFVPGVLF